MAEEKRVKKVCLNKKDSYLCSPNKTGIYRTEFDKDKKIESDKILNRDVDDNDHVET